MFNPKKEFSRFADTYKEQNSIQKDVAKHLYSLISKDYSAILELGCGNGDFFKNYKKDYKDYKAIDISENMCKLHPKSENLKIITSDFDNDNTLFDNRYDIIISSSALQWSKDIDKLISNIANSTTNIAFAIFTSNTFKTIHKIANLTSPIYSKDKLISTIEDRFDVDIEIKEYKLEFDSKQEMFRYIKSSGVSGGTKRLSFCDTKKLIKEYPLDYLEFEVIFFTSKGV
jgi:malonyl-CoA O-methyltransferase